LLLSTRPGERTYHRNFGIDLTPLLFEIPNAATLKTIEENIISGLTQFQPMIITESVDFEIIAEEGMIKIHIHFMIRSTNSRGNYVYPFYLKEANQF
jgi:phage baseplate assembly protein W